MQSGFPSSFALLILVVFFLGGCGDEPEATLRLSISPGTKVKTGETITLNAGESDYDSITWKMDGYYYGKCNTLPTCQLKFDVPDNKTIWIEVAMDHRAHWTGLTRSRITQDSGAVRLSWIP